MGVSPGVNSLHPHRCVCAYCQQAQGWRPQQIVLHWQDWQWIAGQGEPSDVIEQLVKRAGAA